MNKPGNCGIAIHDLRDSELLVTSPDFPKKEDALNVYKLSPQISIADDFRFITGCNK
jgi:hypothetical protein